MQKGCGFFIGALKPLLKGEVPPQEAERFSSVALLRIASLV
jgi:hypothetical protein